MLITKTIKMNWSNNTRKYYESKGYIFTSYKDEFDIKVEHLLTKSSRKVQVKCDVCGEIISKTYENYNLEMSKSKINTCNKCKGLKLGLKTQFSFEFVKEEFNRCNYTLLSDSYSNVKSILSYRCDKHPTEIQETNFGNFKHNNMVCKHCLENSTGKVYKYSITRIKKIFEERGYTLISTKHDYQTKLKYICNSHPEHIQEISLSSFMAGHGCLDCSIDKAKARYKLDYTFVKLQFELKRCVLLENDYINNTTKMKYKCNKHNDIIQETTYDTFNKGFGCRLCAFERITGENNYAWNSTLTEQDRIDRRSSLIYVNWRKEVFERDNYTCQCCGAESHGDINAHHLYNFANYPDYRYKSSNGITLCESCHYELHHKYGKKSNTPEQYEEFKISKQLNIQSIQEAI